MFETIITLEIKTSKIFNLDFAKNTILSRFFFFFLIIDLYFLIPPVITQIVNPIAELAIPRGISTREGKAEMVIDAVIVGIKISGQYNSKSRKHFDASYSSIHFGLFLQ